MPKLPAPPHRTPIVDLYGTLPPVWSDWFKQLFERVGGFLAVGDITTERLADLAVTAAKFADGVITTAKLANGAVTEDKIASNAVTSGKIPSNAITTDKITDLNVTTAKIAAEAVSFAKQLSTDWTNSKASSGYTKLPNGIYVQWGVTGSISSGTNTSVSFPISFPNGCFQVVASVRDNGATATTTTGQWGTSSYSTSSFTLNNRTTSAYTFSYIAVGY